MADKDKAIIDALEYVRHYLPLGKLRAVIEGAYELCNRQRKEIAELKIEIDRRCERIVENLKNANMVEVVRCGECIHNYGFMHQSEDVPYNKNDIVCGFWNTDGLEERNYCCFGERKENENLPRLF